MLATEFINKKKHGESLSCEELDFFIKSYVKGEMPDYQVAALLMAIWFTGMDSRETADLTIAMAKSGDMADLSAIPGIKVDKHSTGGVSDGTTLIVAPLVAACGGKVAKMSGRGLGHTGGTADKLEAIPGYSVSIDKDKFIKNVSEIGLSVISQTGNMVPADKKLYALRDVTETIDSIPLIASSIMSKKIASGCDAIVLDVKTGSGAFMKTVKDSISLAKAMVNIGKLSGRKTIAIVTDMNQPLGFSVGNALEVREAVEVLKGLYESDLKTVSRTLAAHMLIASDICSEEIEALEKIDNAFMSGKALSKLASMIEAQGGNPEIIDNLSLLPAAAEIVSVKADKTGYIENIETEKIGYAAMLLGAGRRNKDDAIDPAVGIRLKKRRGDYVKKGEEIALFHVNSQLQLEEAVSIFISAYTIGENEPDELPLVYMIINE